MELQTSAGLPFRSETSVPEAVEAREDPTASGRFHWPGSADSACAPRCSDETGRTSSETGQRRTTEIQAERDCRAAAATEEGEYSSCQRPFLASACQEHRSASTLRC